ncbi:hypothetical protein B7P43_G10265 [Cryptotermes secundus]|uniref:Uncharacterized protein n=1 Tax=Cryptotermes secundus TaxID=105785 RepID=A0A2J7PEE3_9NEOP|nr:hypothetical protein B7P43_G10265 [Cryptotermes secundus]
MQGYKEVVSSTELSLDMSDNSSVDSGSEAIVFNGSRSMGCQTVYLRSLDRTVCCGHGQVSTDHKAAWL